MQSTTASNGERGSLDLSRLTGQEQRVGEFAVREPLRFATSSIERIAEWTSTSQATVIRTSRSLGFAGVKEMKARCAALVEESRDLAGHLESRLSKLPAADNVRGPGELAQRITSDSADVILALGRHLDLDRFTEAVAAIDGSDRVVAYGLGTASYIAGYAALALERIGQPAVSMTGGGHMNADALLQLHPGDALLVVAPRVIFPDVQALMKHAETEVAHTIVMSQEHLPETAGSRTIHLKLPSAVATSATESVTAWVLVETIVAELARRHADRALETSARLQHYRDVLGGQHKRRR